MAIYVIRSFGSVLILNTTPPLPPYDQRETFSILTTRDGTSTLQTRDGTSMLQTRDGTGTIITR